VVPPCHIRTENTDARHARHRIVLLSGTRYRAAYHLGVEKVSLLLMPHGVPSPHLSEGVFLVMGITGDRDLHQRLERHNGADRIGHETEGRRQQCRGRSWRTPRVYLTSGVGALNYRTPFVRSSISSFGRPSIDSDLVTQLTYNRCTEEMLTGQPGRCQAARDAAATALRTWERTYNYQRFSLALQGRTPAEKLAGFPSPLAA